MITRQEAERMSPVEAAHIHDKEAEDRETLRIVLRKALFHMAAEDKLELLINGDGRISYQEKREKP